MFVTAQAHPRVKFARAINAGNVFLAEVALGEFDVRSGLWLSSGCPGGRLPWGTFSTE